MEKDFLNRKTYKEIKKYNRADMETFIKTMYGEGFKDGSKASASADFKIELVDILKRTKGVGEKTIEKVLETLQEVRDERG